MFFNKLNNMELAVKFTGAVTIMLNHFFMINSIVLYKMQFGLRYKHLDSKNSS